MRKNYLINLLILIACLFLSGGLQAAVNSRAGDYEFSIAHGGLARKYKVYLPQNYDGNTPFPAVIYIHGGGGGYEGGVYGWYGPPGG